MRQPIPFGKYLLLERISVGGMAEVFKAKSFGVEGFEKIIAIKRILPSIAEDAEFIQMFIDEAKIAGQLSHANICQIFELGKITDSHFIAMEFVWGKDLLQIQNRFRKLRVQMPMPMAAFVAAKVCEGLDYAHRRKDALGRPLNIIHRDVSPQNILVSYEGEIKVIDFGIAKAASRSSKTQAGVLKGKFGYMSPEQVRGLPLDRRSDLFAIGTILYETMTGERLFLGESDFSTLEKVRNVDVQPPSALNKSVPPQLEKIVMKALARNVEDRYQWAKEMEDDLQAFLMSQEPVYTAKNLSQWMKDAFQAELDRERQLLEQYKKVGRDGLIQGKAAAEVHIPVEEGLGAAEPMDEGGEATTLGGPTFDEEEVAAMNAASEQLGDEPLDAMDAMGEAPTEIFGEVVAVAPTLPQEKTAILPGGSGSGQAAVIVQSPYRAGQTPAPGYPPGPPAMPPRGVPQPPQRSTVMAGGAPPISPYTPPPVFGAPPQGAPVGNGAQFSPPQAPAHMAPTMAAKASASPQASPARAGGPVPAPPGPILPPSAGGPPIPYDPPEGMVFTPAAASSQAPGTRPLESGNIPRFEAAARRRKSFRVQDVLVGVGVAVVVLGLAVGGYFLFAGRTSGEAAPTTGTLVIAAADTLPADVYLNGDLKGSLRGGDHLRIENLPSGEYSVQLKRAGSSDCEAKIKLEPRGTGVVQCRFAAAQGATLKLEIPDGAVVLVDGSEVSAQAAREPMALAPSVAHQVVVRMEGYVEQTFSLELQPGQNEVRKVELQPLVAEKDRDRRKKAEETTPPVEETKPEKPQTAVVEKPIDKPAPEKPPVEKPATEKPPKPVALKPSPIEPKPPEKPEKPPEVAAPPAEDVGYLIANTTPWARILIDSRDTGKMTPIAPRQKIPLKPGKHTITFVVGDKKFNYPILIEAGKDHRLIKKLPVEE